ncbi:conserved hypothetical protein [Shewanella halifaxensis HAW-EB4]|uniref:DUF3131 domain-containing protein n=1 Tax=Shewanella halifaxensis (strain HAW-EB4) TaxID=458817 RepID=B0TKE6_SHEHH|nr:DUF3131 domain-containing protein [Shewanella halifaxensis]ABZ78532.1 conserved hypothetical protein [Shewanella halifaxensis HAW-EB4]
MESSNSWVKARHHIVFLVGLFTALAIAFSIETREYNQVMGNLSFAPSEQLPFRQTRVLTEQEYLWAKTAWQYFENNYQDNTGLVNSVDGYPSTTMWDTASYLMALISAQRLNVISYEEFSLKTEKALNSLARLPLVRDELPNKAYNTQTLAMVDYNNQIVEGGIGWSAIDIGRILVPMNILIWQYPKFNRQVNAVLQHWQISAMTQDGYLYGARLSSNREFELVQEGRIGYEEYASKALSLMGRDVFNALKYADYLKFININGVDIPTDSRDPDKYHAHNYVVSESYILDSIEFGGDSISKVFAYRVYKAQEERYKKLGVLTAVSEDHIDQAPYFVYNTVFSDGKKWNAITDTGDDASEFRTLSTKAAFGWYSLYDTPYANNLIKGVNTLKSDKEGWYSGLYEKNGQINKTLTANTNGIVLESLAYIQSGALLNIGVEAQH